MRIKPDRHSLILCSVLFLIFLLFAFWSPQAVDNLMLYFLSKLRGEALTSAMSDISATGSRTVTGFVSAVSVYFFLHRRRFVSATRMALAFLGVVLLTDPFKALVERARPTIVYRLGEASGFSYPSGHASGAAGVYFTLALILLTGLKDRRERAGLLALGVGIPMLVSFSRVYLGVHFPTDVIGGLALGAAWALFLEGFLPVSQT